ncbi:MAG: bifunctional pyr operon transcriptional regulator/uracil phosphoribosyltransferase PyrR [Betaproteobacteria bacterium]|nr:bifunctional pyr operon transcriptional regulator/uracil phosphoribosyltransferase PyrR [Betaproteobacteria bacterium]
MSNLPDADTLVAVLVATLRPIVTPETGMIGIVTGGAWLAERLHQELGLKVPLGRLDISFYRDDFSSSGLHASVKPSQVPFSVDDREILLVDDVLYTGRTTRAALNEIFDYGRPKSVRLVVMADRDERQLPIAAQYVGAVIKVPAGKKLQLERDAAGKLSLRLNSPKTANA